MNAVSAEKASLRVQHLLDIIESTQEKDHMNAQSVGKTSMTTHTFSDMREFTREKEPINVQCVGKPSLTARALLHIKGNRPYACWECKKIFTD